MGNVKIWSVLARLPRRSRWNTWCRVILRAHLGVRLFTKTWLWKVRSRNSHFLWAWREKRREQLLEPGRRGYWESVLEDQWPWEEGTNYLKADSQGGVMGSKYTDLTFLSPSDLLLMSQPKPTETFTWFF